MDKTKKKYRLFSFFLRIVLFLYSRVNNILLRNLDEKLKPRTWKMWNLMNNNTQHYEIMPLMLSLFFTQNSRCNHTEKHYSGNHTEVYYLSFNNTKITPKLHGILSVNLDFQSDFSVIINWILKAITFCQILLPIVTSTNGYTFFL